jgi:hypothetical protein
VGATARNVEHGHLVDAGTEHPLQRRVHVQQCVTQPGGDPAFLAGKVLIEAGQHRDVHGVVVVTADRPKRVRQVPAGVSDHEGVPGIGLVPAGMQVGEPAHRQPR